MECAKAAPVERGWVGRGFPVGLVRGGGGEERLALAGCGGPEQSPRDRPPWPELLGAGEGPGAMACV